MYFGSFAPGVPSLHRPLPPEEPEKGVSLYV